MRILMVAPSAVPGGMEDIFLNLAVTLPEFGVTPSVISLQDGALVRRLTVRGVEVDVIDAGRLREPDKLRRAVRQIQATLADDRVTAVFSNMPKAHLYVALAARREGVPALWCQASYPSPPHWIDRIAALLPAAGVIALSRDALAAQQRLTKRLPVHLLHPGIDLQRFTIRNDPALRAEYDIPADTALVSLVGRLDPWKGQREFLRAAAILTDSRPDVRFAIVGGAILGSEGSYPEELARMAAELGLDKRVTFTGHTDEADRWMAASDIVVNASRHEPFGLVVVEAMASGCAVVAVANAGPRDVIDDGSNGLLCRSPEPAELGQAIRRLLDDSGLRARLGQAAASHVRSHFSRDAMTARFVQILEESVSVA